MPGLSATISKCYKESMRTFAPTAKGMIYQAWERKDGGEFSEFRAEGHDYEIWNMFNPNLFAESERQLISIKCKCTPHGWWRTEIRVRCELICGDASDTHTRCAAIRRLECSLREETGEEWTSIINICGSSTRWLNFTLPTSSNVEWSLLSAYMYIKICPVSQCPQEIQPKAQAALLARHLLSWPSILMSQTSWHRNMEQASELSPVQQGPLFSFQ